jgi:hypothetical protein
LRPFPLATFRLTPRVVVCFDVAQPTSRHLPRLPRFPSFHLSSSSQSIGSKPALLVLPRREESWETLLSRARCTTGTPVLSSRRFSSKPPALHSSRLCSYRSKSNYSPVQPKVSVERVGVSQKCPPFALSRKRVETTNRARLNSLRRFFSSTLQRPLHRREIAQLCVLSMRKAWTGGGSELRRREPTRI